jgi:folate-binding protein YgfZ
MEDRPVKRALEAAKASALVIPAPELAVLVVIGGDRRSWLNGLLTCDLAVAREGDGAYGLFTTQKGRILADAIIALGKERALVAIPRGTVVELKASLDHYLVMEDVAFAEGAFDVELAHGPRAGEVLAAMRDAGAETALLDRTGLGGGVAFVPAQGLVGVRAARDKALAAVGGLLGDDRAGEALRIERLVPLFGADFDAATYPQEAGLEKRAVSFSKGCYLGQEVVCMLEMRGHVKRRLVGLKVASDLPPPRGAEVLGPNGEAVGTVTSAAIVPSAGGPVALAMVKRAHAEPGTELRVVGVTATVTGHAA